MSKISKEEYQKITDALVRKGADTKCQRCECKKLYVLDGYIHQDIHNELSISEDDSSRYITCACLMCANCGALTLHSAELLLHVQS